MMDDAPGHALLMARAAARQSPDPKRQVGAAVLDGRGAILAVGCNRPPRGVRVDWLDRPLVRDVVMHAETDALVQAVRRGEPWLLATSYHPCVECVRLAAAAGCSRIVYEEPASPRWEPERVARVAATLGVTMRRVGP